MELDKYALVGPVHGEPTLPAAVGHHHLGPSGVAVEEQVVGAGLQLQGGRHPPPRRVHRLNRRLPKAGRG